MGRDGRTKTGRGLEDGLPKDEAIAIAGKAAAEAAYGALEEPAKKPEVSPDPSLESSDDEYEADVDKVLRTIPLSERRVGRPFRSDVVASVSWGSGDETRSVRLVRTPSSRLSIEGDLVTAPRWALDAVMAALSAWRDGR